MKKLLFLFIILIIGGYFTFTTFYLKDPEPDRICANFIVNIKDSTDKSFIRSKDIETLLIGKKLYPVSKPISSINTLEIEEAILENKLIKSAEVYSTQSGNIIANIKQRKPIMRIISSIDGSYYIDDKRERMPLSVHSTVYVPIATGFINEEFATHELFDFVNYISSHSSWDAWIEQIDVLRNNKVQLILRAGDMKVVLGSLDNYEGKLAKLKVFIDKGLNEVGWNRYSEINLEYGNQVVGTLR